MTTTPHRLRLVSLGLAIWMCAAAACAGGDADREKRVATVMQTPGLVAFWDFVAREPGGDHRFVAHVPVGSPTDYPLDAPQNDKLLSFAANAWLQGRLRRQEGMQEGEDLAFPESQFYTPPEDEPVAVTVVSQGDDERVELREYPFTKLRVTLRRSPAGDWVEADCKLASLRLNPWWYPHDVYTPADATSGGPFTIGRVIHSSRSVGCTGWIGGVAVFDRPLSAAELRGLAGITTVAAAADIPVP